MNIKKLESGQTFKNYRVLCEFLEMEIKTGKAKQLQMKDLQRYCSIKKVGHSISITSVFEEPIPSIDGRGRDTIYGELLQLIFTDIFINSEENRLLLTRNKLLESANLLNLNYKQGALQTQRLSEYMNINKEVVDDFYNTSKGNFKYMIESTLESLRRKSLIMYHKVTMVCDSKNRHRIATADEMAAILEQETKVMKQLSCEDVRQVIVSGQWEAYKLNVRKLLKEYKIQYYYSSYDIVINKKYIEEKHNDMLIQVSDKVKNAERKSEANSLICNRLLDNAKRRKDDSDFNSKLHSLRTSSDYIDANSQLIELLVRENTNIHLLSEFSAHK